MRKTRELKEETKIKISNSLKGRKRTNEEREKIKVGMLKYWASIPAQNKKVINDC